MPDHCTQILLLQTRRALLSCCKDICVGETFPDITLLACTSCTYANPSDTSGLKDAHISTIAVATCWFV